MKGQSVKLQDQGKFKYEEYAGYSWFFIVDTCEELAGVTGKTDCVPKEQVRKIMNHFAVTTKTISQFFSEKAYIDNELSLDASFEVERFMLSKSQGSQISYNV